MTTMLKRDRLIEAAKAKFYQQGVARTTLADIAQQAQVPLGNVYYHFRTKEALVEAVVQAHTQELHAMFGKWERIADPCQRLLALLQTAREQEHALARYGCLHGSSLSRARQRGRSAGQRGGPDLSGLPGLDGNANSPARQGRARGQGFSHRPDLVVAGNVCLDGDFSFS